MQKVVDILIGAVAGFCLCLGLSRAADRLAGNRGYRYLGSETISTEPQTSYVEQEASAKVEAWKRLTADEADAILAELDAAKADFAALEETSKAKDSTIDDLTAENLKLKDETGTKAYLMLDGIIGFSEGYPEYGVGLTVGTRLGNSLMLELGADYMLGGNLADLMDFSIDDFTFRAGIGWMF